MLFNPKIYQDNVGEMILKNIKTETRRMWKPNFIYMQEQKAIVYMTMRGRRIKWKAGHTFAVQLGRGQPGLKYCPECLAVQENRGRGYQILYHNYRHTKPCKLKKVRPVIKNVWPETLFDIKKSSLEAEGEFTTLNEYLKAFYEANKKESIARKALKALEEGKSKEELKKIWNPKVAVIKFLGNEKERKR